MNLSDSETVGAVAIVSIGLLSGYYLLLRIREEYFREKPDPKLTYATRRDLENLRQDVRVYQREFHDLIHRIDDKRTKAMNSAFELIHQNAEHIATLIAQQNMTLQRLSELTVKTDRLQDKCSR